MSDSEINSLKHIIQTIYEYEENRIGIKTLIAELETVLSGLESLEASLRKGLFENWGVLEEIYSDCICKSRNLSNRDNRLINASLKNIKNIVDQLIKNHSVE